MANNKKAMQAGTRTASNTALDTRNHTASSDPLRGWFDLAKPSRDRRQKKSWKRKQRGQVDPLLIGNLLLIGIGFLLIVGTLTGWAQ